MNDRVSKPMDASRSDAVVERGGASAIAWWQAIAVFAVLLAFRVLGSFSTYFWEEDEIGIANGVAALVRDDIGGLYRYTVQLGYYRWVEFVNVVLGGDVSLVPWIMKMTSATAGALIPALGLLAFRRELSRGERWLLVLVLAVNPIRWKSSQYGNSAMFATALVTASLVILSNRPARAWTVVALALFGVGALARADAVVLAPLVAFLLYRIDGSVKQAAVWCVGFGVVMVLVYGAVFLFDPRTSGVLSTLSEHMASGEIRTRFWELLLWAMSPIPLLFAVMGLHGLLEKRPQLLVVVLLWAVPVMLFYYRATTTPRYFLNAVFPLAIAGAVGMAAVGGRLRTWFRAPVAWTVVLGLATVHLFVAMERFRADGLGYPLYGATVITHDGPMPTGALLYMTYRDSGTLINDLPDLTFGESTAHFWEGASFRNATARLADPGAPDRTVIVIFSGGWDQAFHFHAQAAGARYVSRVESPMPFSTETWLELGNTRVMTIALWSTTYPDLPAFDVRPGDQMWIPGGAAFPEFPDSMALAKLPAGLALRAAESFDPHFLVFDVTSAGPATDE